ncbi:homing endonuclease associated repeat-containing protein [Natranaeroarchaeum sulfidigenes]|uniref:Uncharacterized protein n=1 Tax=Natranaeroarchaeum sulfidigenes TaxID=2784880 RepID=A0A897MR86_9EURY|nr:hypothetical protein [Natranaeroarchaeum sulfidigenes]QSG02831.1 hypothetical protein AArcS_1620 [Natranaeroarchaeum sulfidigenes]
MNDLVDCPVDTCSFGGSVLVVADHIAETNNEAHTWDALGHANADEFCYTVHFEEGQRLQNKAEEARNLGEYEIAIETMERALRHFQRANVFEYDTSSAESRCQEVQRTLNEIETDEQEQVIDELVDEAENAIDTGDKAHFDGNTEAAAQAYETAVNALEEARRSATQSAPDRIPKINQELNCIRVRQQSLDLSTSHQRVRELAADARDHAAAGNGAFQNSEYETALEEYEKARDRYESLADALQEFSFDDPTNDSSECDVCRHRFDNRLDDWQIEFDASLQVCPSCARFGPGGNLPSPQDVATELRTVMENIERIRDGDIGLTWSSGSNAQPDETDDNDTEAGSRDRRQMLVQLVGLYQQLGSPPTAEEIDGHTNFGFLAYRDEFGSISDALREAGFDS